VVSVTLFVFAVVSALCGWFLSRFDLERATQYAGIIQAIVAVFGLSAIAIAIMAFVAPSEATKHVQKNRGDRVFGVQGGTIYINGQAPSPEVRVDGMGKPDGEGDS